MTKYDEIVAAYEAEKAYVASMPPEVREAYVRAMLAHNERAPDTAPALAAGDGPL